VDEIIGIHQAQVLTYIKLAPVRTSLLINFNVPKLKDGLRRFVI
jgi:GxxExxY protein